MTITVTAAVPAAPPPLTSPVFIQGLNGAQIDGDWYVAVTKFAERTGWLHGPVLAYTDVLGLGLFALLLLAAWWTARSASAKTMTAALWARFPTVGRQMSRCGREIRASLALATKR